MKEALEYAERARTGRRTRFIYFLFAMIFIAYGSLLWYHQVLEGATYVTLAGNNFLRQQEVESYRGNIVDRHGRVLVSNRLSFNVLLNRETESDTAAMLSFLVGVLDLEASVVAQRLEEAARRPAHQAVMIAEDVALSQAVSIEARRLEWPELSIEVAPRRTYPDGRMAAHLLGYVGEISLAEIRSGRFQEDLGPGDIIGKTGIERVYEGDLQGIKGYKRVMINSRGRVMEDVGVDREPEHGADVVLTVDRGLQQALETGLAGHVGAAVFLDPWTGEILAMASAPAFEPNLFARRFAREEWDSIVSDPLRPLQNRATRSRFSPGSTFKIILAAAALEEGVVTANTRVFCGGSGVFYNRRFRCHKAEGHGEVDLEEALIYSCNIYFYTVGKQLGIEKIGEYARRMGLGEETGIDLVSEDDGLVPSPAWKQAVRGERWYAGETISVSIGGGPIAVTPIQMATVAAGLANGGRRVTPHLRYRGAAAEEQEARRQRGEVGFSAGTMAALRTAMSGVVERGTGTATTLPGITVAAKTGTAQYSSQSAGIDADDLPYEIRDHAWMVGFAPAGRPSIAFAVFIEHGGHGGTTAAPVVRGVLERFFGLVDEPDETRPAPPAASPPGTEVTLATAP